jgi:phosphoribosylformylglycinamidine (FGAM) synthase-like enzyme
LGTLPSVDLGAVSRLASLVRDLVGEALVSAVHDVAEGGLGAALAEMAVASDVGWTVARIHGLTELFGESPGRVVVAVAPEGMGAVEELAAAAGVEVSRVGLATGDRLVVKGLLDLPLERVVAEWRDRLPLALGGGTTQG